jgi:hypothetical protein
VDPGWFTVPNRNGISNLTPEQLRIRASVSANERWAKATAADREAHGIRGQQGLKARFEREVREAAPGLTDAEYALMAENKYQAHMQRMAFASSKARARKAAGDAA